MARFSSKIIDQEWTRLCVDSAFLMSDAAMVMGLRAMRMMAGGPKAIRETGRAMTEKVDAGFELAGAVAAGKAKTPEAAALKAIEVAAKRVRANRKRLG